MYLPARPPKAESAWALLVLVEGGMLAMGACWMFAPDYVRWPALVVAAGIAWFLVLVAGMLRNRLPAPPALRRPDIGMLHALQAIAYLLIAAGTGLFILFSDRFEHAAVMAYGTFVLLGFFGQLILGIQMRLLPMYAWLRTWTENEYRALPVSPHERPIRPLQAASFLAWTAGVPVLAYGLAQAHDGFVSTGAWTLVAGTLAATLSTLRVLRRN
jgi:hypothetical protein